MPDDLAAAGAFAANFIPAIVKLRNAANADEGCQLTAPEVHGIIEAFALLRDHARGDEP